MKKKKWNPPKFYCIGCGWVLWSRWQGDFRSCSCEIHSFVDQTEYYVRAGGSIVPLDISDDCVYFNKAEDKFQVKRYTPNRKEGNLVLLSKL